MADPTRLELATSGSTGRRSNHLNYGSSDNILSPVGKLVKDIGLESFARSYLLGG